MARHLLRDYFGPATGNSSTTFIGSYLATIFMRRVLGYSHVGSTNYPINSVGTMLISTADSTPTSTPTFAGGTKAGINLGLNLEFNASIPVATRTVINGDIGRILVLRSTTNPQYNSGCYLITGIDSGSNSYKLDFRSGAYLSGASSISSVSSGSTLPTGTITVNSTTGFPSSGTILVVSTNGVQTVNYTSISGTQFFGCTGGTGTIAVGNFVNSQVTLPQSTLLVNSTTGFPTATVSSPQTIFVWSSTGRQTITYTGLTSTSFLNCTGGTGNIIGGTTSTGHGASPFVNTVTTTIAAGSNGQSLPQSTINVASTTTATTTIAAGSNNVLLPTGTINVGSTTSFPTVGSIYVTTNLGQQLVTYTGTTATTFTGCTGGTGYMSTGGAISAGFSTRPGIIYVTTSAGVQQVSYTGTTGTTFTGCSGGTGTMSTGGSVYYSASVPRIEASDSMNWYLYEKDATAAALLVQGTSNSNPSGQYRGNGTSTTPRIILQSPSTLGWQVRVCHETTNDSGVGNSPLSAECPLISFAPGFGGDSSGDFAVAGPHLHAPLFFNSNSNNLQGGVVGFGDNLNIPSGTTVLQYRYTMIGDDTDGYGCTIIGRRPGNAGSPRSFLLTFGQVEQDTPPLPPNNEARLFAIGSANSQSSGNNLNDTSWYPGNITSSGVTSQGVTMNSAVGTYITPMSCNITLMTYATGSGSQGGPIFDGSAGDSPFFGGVELVAADLISGIFNTWNGSGPTAYGFPRQEGRFMGTIPHIREGRTNYAEYSITADQVAQHIRRGVWMLWGGPPVIT
jgi:hypothetical protein